MQIYYYKSTFSQLANFTQIFHFIYPWRSYQKRFLDDFETHFEDKYLHVVAPPGSGKTVLGLEMIKRVNKPTLVLTPTITIRNQWSDRMKQCFLKPSETLHSTFDLKSPSHLTISTYQSLHSLFKNDCASEPSKLIERIKQAGFNNIVLDEAHHLKNEWWRPLFALKEIENISIISLTATPPYDSDSNEIKKYFDLCGPIDVEIGIPELVKEGDLCPHQDYIYFSKPEQSSIDYIIEYRERLHQFINDFKENVDVQEALLHLPIIKSQKDHLDSIYDNAEFYASIIIYLNSAGQIIEKEQLEVLGFTNLDIAIPSFTYEHANTLLTHILITNRSEFIEIEETLLYIEKRLKRLGVFNKQRINFKGDKSLFSLLSQSPSKLNSINAIIELELAQMGDNLRAVVLCDFIRKEYLNFTGSPEEINKLGVLPVFQFLKQKLSRKQKLGVLTGSIIVLHHSVIADLRKIISSELFTIRQQFESEYLIIQPSEKGRQMIVGAVTQLFEKGKIQILIGTRSLLGEGWDAPTVNTLILASYVGSYVTSNQMRGRAIRTTKDQPNKVATIWHLACLDPTSQDGGEDWIKLAKRFEAFGAVSLDGEPYIESGVERLGLDFLNLEVETFNQKMISASKKRLELPERWEKALVKGDTWVHELKIKYKAPRTFMEQKKVFYRDMVRKILLEIGAALIFVLPELLLRSLNLLKHGVQYFIYALGAALVSIFFKPTLKAIRLYFHFGRMDKIILNFCNALLEAMKKEQLISDSNKDILAKVDFFEDGTLTCYVKGATAKEEILFSKYLKEILDPIDNPRYIISQSNWLRSKLGFSNYFTVPALFSSKKQKATLFHTFWTRFNKKGRLVFTRNIEGRAILIKARYYHLKHSGRLESKESLIWK